MGGTIAVHTDRGDEVRVLVVTDGSSTQYPGDAETRARKEEEALRAAAELGVTDYVHLDLPDMRLDTLPHVEVNRVIEEHVGDFSPQVVYTPQPGRESRPPRALRLGGRRDPARARASPCAASSRTRRPRAPSGHLPRSTGSCRTGSWTSPRRSSGRWRRSPTTRRSGATIPHPRSERAIRAAAEFYGSSCGCEHAEPFVLVRGLEVR